MKPPFQVNINHGNIPIEGRYPVLHFIFGVKTRFIRTTTLLLDKEQEKKQKQHNLIPLISNMLSMAAMNYYPKPFIRIGENSSSYSNQPEWSITESIGLQCVRKVRINTNIIRDDPPFQNKG